MKKYSQKWLVFHKKIANFHSANTEIFEFISATNYS